MNQWGWWEQEWGVLFKCLTERNGRVRTSGVGGTKNGATLVRYRENINNDSATDVTLLSVTVGIVHFALPGVVCFR